MIPNWQSPAYALFARRPIVPQPPDVLAADPPASQEPLPPSVTEDAPVTECPLPAPAVAAASAPIVKILSAFVKQRTYQPPAHRQLHASQAFKPLRGILSDLGVPRWEGHFARRDNQERINRTSFHGSLW